MSNQPPAKPGQTIPQKTPRNADPTHTKHPNFAEGATGELPKPPRRTAQHVTFYAPDRLFNPAKHGCRWLDRLGMGWARPSGPHLRGSCLRDRPPLARISLIVTPPIARTQNE